MDAEQTSSPYIPQSAAEVLKSPCTLEFGTSDCVDPFRVSRPPARLCYGKGA